jgi:hypothetical protein
MKKDKVGERRASGAGAKKRPEVERPLFRLSSREVYARGVAALDARDRPGLVECIAELEDRESQYAGESADELSQKGEGLLGPRAPQHAGASFPIDASQLHNITVLTDDAIVRARAEMIRAATNEIWLSSYIWRDADPLTDLLCAKATIQHGVHVIISSGPGKHDKVQLRIKRLQDAGVHVYCRESSHSKCVVVDGMDVLLGSANVDRSHRDLSIRAQGNGLANSVRRYLLEVSKPRERAESDPTARGADIATREAPPEAGRSRGTSR